MNHVGRWAKIGGAGRKATPSHSSQAPPRDYLCSHSPHIPPSTMSATPEAGLKIAAVEVPSNESLERRTRDGKWTLRQLRQTDAIVPLQSGTNQFDSQRRDLVELIHNWLSSDRYVCGEDLQGKTGFGMPRNTQTKVEFADEDKQWSIEEQKHLSDAIVRLQSGTNQYESQKVFCFSSFVLQQRKALLHVLCCLRTGKTGFGMPRNTQTKVEFADQDKQWSIEEQKHLSDAIVRLQSGTNQYESQKGKTGFGMPRNTQTKVDFSDGDKRWTVADQHPSSDGIVRLQSGTNQYESQKGMTSFGAPRDVKGKHLKRIWELEFPEEALESQPVNGNPHSKWKMKKQQKIWNGWDNWEKTHNGKLDFGGPSLYISAPPFCASPSFSPEKCPCKWLCVWPSVHNFQGSGHRLLAAADSAADSVAVLRPCPASMPLLPLCAACLLVSVSAEFDPCLSVRGTNMNSLENFASPNFPSKYPPNLDCVRVVHSRPGHDVLVTFHHMFQIESTYDKLEAGTDCPNDFIEFRDGRYGFSPLIGRFCGRQLPYVEIRAVSGFMWIRFRTDAMLEYSGFSAKIALVPARNRRDNMHQCLMEYLNGLDGFVRTQDLISSLVSRILIQTGKTTLQPLNVSGTLDCVWRLSVPENYKIALYIHEFVLTAPNQCGQNFLEVYAGGTADKPIRRFCGLSATDVFSPSSEVLVRFFLSDVRLLNSTRVTALFSSYTRHKNCSQPGLFACGDENCVPATLACNNRANCPYGRDEAVCHVAQDRLWVFLTSGFAPLVSLITAVFIVVAVVCVYTIRSNRCSLPPL
ncbi:unnamed protein product [Caenorhabditis auriculariae]|uniref:CUB domain-containing protein n=1 Tax=Caenorhabditis auriculariae TaxID=2777116 RepID=A0A8S1HK41_9PELO|nr:unnamed protein product [Caenorhabditis auriculariae]